MSSSGMVCLNLPKPRMPSKGIQASAAAGSRRSWRLVGSCVELRGISGDFYSARAEMSGDVCVLRFRGPARGWLGILAWLVIV
jgi:hypothetical protein